MVNSLATKDGDGTKQRPPKIQYVFNPTTKKVGRVLGMRAHGYVFPQGIMKQTFVLNVVWLGGGTMRPEGEVLSTDVSFVELPKPVLIKGDKEDGNTESKT